ncbi:HSP20 family molecular chaperone IbpA [Oikeobacillus pervagus]|uniref:HSP20 family molecular chaperone IbpA n=1 Tax=Oikeobacillus pervagus TaxID=1325931 RepID=A0AAJ1WJR5_9BACI|nr:Hsp20/alpha crystallin family protein [Oikeobacillus pervagus]MDQ0214351.1 HSP20 family molecular chaperone IbpA [Oikeobacillus pervagus]
MLPWDWFPTNQTNSNEWFKKMNFQTPTDVEQYVQSMLEKAATLPNIQPQQAEQAGQNDVNEQSPLQLQVFETFDYIYIRMKIDRSEWFDQIKIFHTANKAIIENIPEMGDRQEILLPQLVRKKGATAQYKDGIMEISFPVGVDMQFTEIDLTEKRN